MECPDRYCIDAVDESLQSGFTTVVIQESLNTDQPNLLNKLFYSWLHFQFNVSLDKYPCVEEELLRPPKNLEYQCFRTRLTVTRLLRSQPGPFLCHVWVSNKYQAKRILPNNNLTASFMVLFQASGQMLGR